MCPAMLIRPIVMIYILAVVILQVREILQEEEDLSEIVQLVGKVTDDHCFIFVDN